MSRKPSTTPLGVADAFDLFIEKAKELASRRLVQDGFETGIIIRGGGADGLSVEQPEPGGTKPSPRTIDRAIDLGYELHVRHAIEAATPFEIICVGKGVGDVLATRLRRTGATITVVPQPNARMTTAEHDLALATYRDVVRRAAGTQHERATPC